MVVSSLPSPSRRQHIQDEAPGAANPGLIPGPGGEGEGAGGRVQGGGRASIAEGEPLQVREEISDPPSPLHGSIPHLLPFPSPLPSLPLPLSLSLSLLPSPPLPPPLPPPPLPPPESVPSPSLPTPGSSLKLLPFFMRTVRHTGAICLQLVPYLVYALSSVYSL